MGEQEMTLPTAVRPSLSLSIKTEPHRAGAAEPCPREPHRPTAHAEQWDNGPMTKAELIQRIALKQPHLSERDVELAVKRMLDQMRVLTRFVQKYTLTLCCGTGTSRLGTEAVSGCLLEPSRRPVGVQHRDKNGLPRIGATRNGIRMESVPLQVGTGCQWRKSPYLLDGHPATQSPTHRAG